MQPDPDRPENSPDAGDVVGLLREVCDAAARELSASGVGLSVTSESGAPSMVAASDAATARIEELQFTFGEGPCMDAVTARRPVLVPDLEGDAMSRWPVYAPAAHDAGMRAVFAFPLQVGAAQLGVLDVFRTSVGPLSRIELGQAFTFADQTVTILLDGQDRAAANGDGLEEAIEYRAELFQAQGMVMVQLGVSLAEAMARMRARAYAEDRPISEMAADIVARRLRFDEDGT